MPEQPDAPPRPPVRRTGINRTLLLSLCALLAGYWLAGSLRGGIFGGGEAVADFETMNTYGRIRVPSGSGSSVAARTLADDAEQAVRRVNDLMSPVGPHSDIRRLNEAAAGEWVEVDPLTWTVVMEALRWHRLSDGAFDPTIGPIKRLFTFDRSTAESWPDAAALAEAGSRVGADKLRFDREGMRLSWAVDGMRLDLGAIAKGFGADMAAESLIAGGVRNALVEIGGELRVLGHRPGDGQSPWKVGVQNPRGGEPLETIEVSNAAVATSGDYERFFIYDGRRYEHIIDPRTGLPLEGGVSSVTVIHPGSCLAADALATTMCVLGPEDGRRFLERQALGLFSRGVRVIMLTALGDGGVRRLELVVDTDGGVRADDSVVRP